jgi:hypothetical protein
MPAPSSSPIPPVLANLATAADIGRLAGPGLVAALAKAPDPRARRGAAPDQCDSGAGGLRGARRLPLIRLWVGAE